MPVWLMLEDMPSDELTHWMAYVQLDQSSDEATVDDFFSQRVAKSK